MLTSKNKCFLIFSMLILPLATGLHGAESDRKSEKEFSPSTMQRLVAEEMDITCWDTDQGLAKIVSLPTGKGNAAEDYGKLEDTFNDDLVEGQQKVRLDAKGLDIIASATTKKKCKLVPAYLQPMVNRWTPTPNTIVFMGYTNALIRRSAELESAMQYADARKALEQILIMGWHFTEDRPSIVTMSLGLTMQAQAIQALEKFYTRQMELAKARQCREYRSFLQKTMNSTVYKNKFQLGKWADFRSLYACMVCATKDEDLAWRQEALLNLGVLQNGYPSADLEVWHTDPVQQQAASDTLKKVARSDKVASVRKLAKWCLDEMTLENIRKWQQKGNRKKEE